MTAGNSSQTSDGAAAALVMSDTKARELGLKPMARFVSFATAGVPPEIMGIGPVVAIPKALALAGLKLDDIGVIELNEAFAAQALAVIREAGLDPERVNVNGGAIALGHPLGCTGAKLTATILREMERRKVALRHGHHVRRRRPGRRRNFRNWTSGITDGTTTSLPKQRRLFLIEERQPAAKSSRRKTSPKNTAPSPAPPMSSGPKKSRRNVDAIQHQEPGVAVSRAAQSRRARPHRRRHSRKTTAAWRWI